MQKTLLIVATVILLPVYVAGFCVGFISSPFMNGFLDGFYWVLETNQQQNKELLYECANELIEEETRNTQK